MQPHDAQLLKRPIDPNAILTVVGLMSGTSMDGIDAAILRSDGGRIIEPGPAMFTPYTDDERAILKQALADARAIHGQRERPGVLREAENIITARHAAAVKNLTEKAAIGPADIDAVAFHGQTVLHRPEDMLTVQIGDGAVLAAELGVPVVGDFRSADVAAGGEGAPLVPAYHRGLVERAGTPLPVCVLNLGGVSNLTFIDENTLLAFDIGPANALIDDWMLARTGQAFDADGSTAKAGKVNKDALKALLSHPYFKRPPPKSLDRDAFSLDPVGALSLEDGAATLTAFTAKAIGQCMSFLPQPPQSWIASGGGARNPVMLAMISDAVGMKIDAASAIGADGDFVEAQAFAYLAVRALKDWPVTFPGTTGVAKPLTGGVLRVP